MRSPRLKSVLGAGLALALLVALAPSAGARTNILKVAWEGGDTDVLITPPTLPTTVTGRILLENPFPAGDLARITFHLFSYDAEIENLTSAYGPVTRVYGDRYEIVPPVPLPLPQAQTTEVATFTVAVPTADQIDIGLGADEYELADGTVQTLEENFDWIWAAWINPAAPVLSIPTVLFEPRGTNRGAIYRQVLITNDNPAGPFFFDPLEVGNDCGPFRITNPADLVVISPGSFAWVTVRFGVTEPGEYACNLPLGGSAALPVQGTWRNPIHVLTATPDTAGFGPVPVGGSADVAITFVNDGDYYESLAPVVTGEAGLLSFDFSGFLAPSGERTQRITYTPPDFAARSWHLDYGGLAQVDLTGSGRPGTADFTVSQDTLRITAVAGESANYGFRISNVGEVTITPTFVLDDPSGLFTVVDAAPPTIPAGQNEYYAVSYAPPDHEIRQASLEILPGMPELVLVGEGLFPYPAAEVTPDFLEFPPVAVGESVTATFTVKNTGNAWLDIANISTAPEVTVPYLNGMNPGMVQTLTATCTPTTWGQVTGRIRVATQPLLEVEFVAPPVFPYAPGENRVGVFFDTAHTEQDTTVAQPPQAVPAALVLHDPSEPQGVAAWSCRVKTPPGVVLTGAWPAGTYFDAAAPLDEFSITMLGAPLPPGAATVLADLQFLLWDPAVTAATIEVRPLSDPLLPGLPTWTPGDPAATPVAMVVTPGAYAAGTIRVRDPYSPVPDEVPAPRTTRLLGNVPNPFNPRTEIRFELARAATARVRVYDLQGRLVRELLATPLPAGPHAVVWDGRDRTGRAAASGAYYVRLDAGGHSDSRKILLLK